jgi:hypothetical protein
MVRDASEGRFHVKISTLGTILKPNRPTALHGTETAVRR